MKRNLTIGIVILLAGMLLGATVSHWFGLQTIYYRPVNVVLDSEGRPVWPSRDVILWIEVDATVKVNDASGVTVEWKVGRDDITGTFAELLRYLEESVPTTTATPQATVGELRLRLTGARVIRLTLHHPHYFGFTAAGQERYLLYDAREMELLLRERSNWFTRDGCHPSLERTNRDEHAKQK